MRGPDLVPVLWQLAIAALGGLAVGFEREWSARRDGDVTRFGGVRTFLLLGLAGGLAAVVAREVALSLGAVILAGGLGLVAIAYHATASAGRVDATTEVAGVVVLAAGVLAGAGWLAAAGAVYAVTALALVEKGRLHGWVERIRSEELEATFRFAVLALVLLPVLPTGPFGPGYGLRPREVWALVLLFSALSFAGYLALRVAGAERGYGLAGLLGGVVSSTAVTLNFARESRRAPDQGSALALGVLAACTVLPLRVVLLSALLNREVGLAAGRLLLPSFAAGALGLGLLLRRRRPAAEAPVAPPGNPLRLGAAMQLALAFQVVLYLVEWAEARFGASGVYATATLTGLTDLDALTYSMSRLAGGIPVGTAARALAVGVIANSLFKLVLAAALGRGAFRPTVATGLAGLAAVTALALLLL